MTIKTFVDFETHSMLDLREVGVYAYSAHPTTDIICMCWAVDDDDVCLWTPSQPYPLTWDALGEFWAHNANFERIIWREITSMCLSLMSTP